MGAATAACGAGSTTAYSQEWGAGYVMGVQFGAAVANQPIRLVCAGPGRHRGLRLIYEGTVAPWYQAGILGPAVGRTWPTDGVYTYEYTPDGQPTNLCLGTTATAGHSTPVTLQPCGVDSRTLWIMLSVDFIGGYIPSINGSDTVTSAPYALTAGDPGRGLITEQLFLSAATFAPGGIVNTCG